MNESKQNRVVNVSAWVYRGPKNPEKDGVAKPLRLLAETQETWTRIKDAYMPDIRGGQHYFVSPDDGQLYPYEPHGSALFDHDRHNTHLKGIPPIDSVTLHSGEPLTITGLTSRDAYSRHLRNVEDYTVFDPQQTTAPVVPIVETISWGVERPDVWAYSVTMIGRIMKSKPETPQQIVLFETSYATPLRINVIMG